MFCPIPSLTHNAQCMQLPLQLVLASFLLPYLHKQGTGWHMWYDAFFASFYTSKKLLHNFTEKNIHAEPLNAKITSWQQKLISPNHWSWISIQRESFYASLITVFFFWYLLLSSTVQNSYKDPWPELARSCLPQGGEQHRGLLEQHQHPCFSFTLLTDAFIFTLVY